LVKPKLIKSCRAEEEEEEEKKKRKRRKEETSVYARLN
jgi:hypothetical protein